MTTITEFLLTRIAEDEAVARGAADVEGEGWTRGVLRYDERFDAVVMLDQSEVPIACSDEDAATHIARHDPARVLVDCKAKKAIVELYIETEKSRAALDDMYGDPDLNAVMGPLRDVLRSLASVYADLPEFESGWVL